MRVLVTRVTPPSSKRAFSLVELSIVLVILGLLVGGVLAGQSLIRAAELRSVSTQYAQYITATQAFRDKYFALPGDMNNATSFWGATAACPGTAGTGTQTCNGDGDGILDFAAAGSEYGETFTYWQHLANAGLIEGRYDGIAGASALTRTTTNSPPAKVGASNLWFAWNWNTTYTGVASVYDGTYRDNLLEITNLSGYVLKTEEAWNIDKKIDDGRPAYGKMRERMWDDCTDATSSADLDSDYALSATGIVCHSIFWIQ